MKKVYSQYLAIFLSVHLGMSPLAAAGAPVCFSARRSIQTPSFTEQALAPSALFERSVFNILPKVLVVVLSAGVFTHSGFAQNFHSVHHQIVDVKNEEALQGLIKNLGDSDSFVRFEAAQTLQKKKGFKKDLLEGVVDYLEMSSFGHDLLGSAHREELVALLRRSRQLGINSPFRFSYETLKTIVDNREHPVADGRPLAIVLLPQYDYDGALYFLDYVNSLIDHHYRVMVYEGASGEQWIEELNDAKKTQQARVVVFAAHPPEQYGIPHGYEMQLGRPSFKHLGLPSKTDSITIIPGLSWPTETMWEQAADSMEEGGQIIFDSCNAGKDEASGLNFVNFFRKVFSRAHPKAIWGATHEFRGSPTFEFNQDDTIQNVSYGTIRTYRSSNDEIGNSHTRRAA